MYNNAENIAINVLQSLSKHVQNVNVDFWMIDDNSHPDLIDSHMDYIIYKTMTALSNQLDLSLPQFLDIHQKLINYRCTHSSINNEPKSTDTLNDIINTIQEKIDILKTQVCDHIDSQHSQKKYNIFILYKRLLTSSKKLLLICETQQPVRENTHIFTNRENICLQFDVSNLNRQTYDLEIVKNDIDYIIFDMLVSLSNQQKISEAFKICLVDRIINYLYNHPVIINYLGVENLIDTIKEIDECNKKYQSRNDNLTGLRQRLSKTINHILTNLS